MKLAPSPCEYATRLPACAPLREPAIDTFVILAGRAPRKLICVRYDASTLPGAGLTVTPPIAADCSSAAGAHAGAEAPAAAAAARASKAGAIAAHELSAMHASTLVATGRLSRGALIRLIVKRPCNRRVGPSLDTLCAARAGASAEPRAGRRVVFPTGVLRACACGASVRRAGSRSRRGCCARARVRATPVRRAGPRSRVAARVWVRGLRAQARHQ